MKVPLPKSSTQDRSCQRKIQDATGENCQLFIYSKTFQWQYKEAMQFESWVARKTAMIEIIYIYLYLI